MKASGGGSNLRMAVCNVALGLTLCVSAGTGCHSIGVQAGAASYADPYLIVHDSTLAHQISVVSVDYDEVGDLARGTATLRSNRDRSLEIQYRFSWYDKTGREIAAKGQPYHNLIIGGRDAVTVSSGAPNPSAQEFKIRIKKLRPIKAGM